MTGDKTEKKFKFRISADFGEILLFKRYYVNSYTILYISYMILRAANVRNLPGRNRLKSFGDATRDGKKHLCNISDATTLERIFVEIDLEKRAASESKIHLHLQFTHPGHKTKLLITGLTINETTYQFNTCFLLTIRAFNPSIPLYKTKPKVIITCKKKAGIYQDPSYELEPEYPAGVGETQILLHRCTEIQNYLFSQTGTDISHSTSIRNKTRANTNRATTYSTESRDIRLISHHK